VPWSDCNDAQRLDVHNGLLLSALWDAAFDKASSASPTTAWRAPATSLSATARQALAIDTAPALSGLRDAHRANLAAHRAMHGF
jgi:hypothetical protein